MNLMALLAGLLPWAATPASAFVRLYLACSLLSIEAQAITWLGRGSLNALVPLNVVIGVALIGWHVARQRPVWRWLRATRACLPMPVVLALATVVVALNLRLPVAAADPYQLDRILQIERSGSLIYSLAIDSKANIVGAFYELVLADLQGITGIGPWLVRLHGLLGIAVFSLAVAAVQTWLPIRSTLGRTALFVVPVVFNQFVLIKNDLFIGAPAFVVLAWAVGGASRARPGEIIRAGWLVGLVVAAKLTNLALAVVVGVLIFLRERTWRALATGMAGLLAGIVAGGLVLTLWQNAHFYGDALATQEVEAIGSVNVGVGAALVGLGRFVVSWFDLGLVTRTLWPGRGGWGGTFGLPFVWALVVLVLAWRSQLVARRALVAGLVCLLALGVVFPDADLSHRLALGPGLLLIAAGASNADVLGRRGLHLALVAVVSLSALQILRSAALYAIRM